MAGLLAFAGAGLLAGGTLGGATSPASALVDCSVADSGIDAEEAAFLGLLNDYRAASGLGPLTLSTNLSRGATWIIESMAAGHYFAHTDSRGRSPYQRGLDCGYPEGAAENLAGGWNWDTAREVFDAWAASSGHSQNMLGSFYTQVGVARLHDANADYGWYWAATFGAANDGTGVTPSAPSPQPSAAPPAAEAPAAATLAGVAVSRGANLLAWTGPPERPSTALGVADAVVYAFDTATGSWLRYGAAFPPALNTLSLLQPGQAYWVLANRDGTLTGWQ